MLYLPDSFTDGDELLKICTKFRLEGIVSMQAATLVRDATRLAATADDGAEPHNHALEKCCEEACTVGM